MGNETRPAGRGSLRNGRTAGALAAAVTADGAGRGGGAGDRGRLGNNLANRSRRGANANAELGSGHGGCPDYYAADNGGDGASSWSYRDGLRFGNWGDRHGFLTNVALSRRHCFRLGNRDNGKHWGCASAAANGGGSDGYLTQHVAVIRVR